MSQINSLENKTTTELLDFLYKFEKLSDDKQDWDKFCEAQDELKKREPFKYILGECEFENEEPTLEEQVKELIEEVKKLKRHKHDEKTNDVLIRI